MAQGSVERREGPRGVRWRGRVELGFDPLTGKRRTLTSTHTTKKAAQQWVAAQINAQNEGTSVLPSKLTVADLLRTWLNDVAAHTVSPSTLVDYRTTVDKHLIPGLGTIRIQALKPAQVQAFYAERLAAGLGPRSVQLCHLRLSQALKQAVKWGYVPRNVCEAVDPPRADPRRRELWTVPEARRFLDTALGDPLHPLWLVAITTGARQGELLALRWSDYNPSKLSLAISRSVSVIPGGLVVKEPKSRSGYRTIGVPVEVAAELDAHRARQAAVRAKAGAAWHELDLIFCTEIGTLLYPSNVLRSFYRLMERAGVPKVRFHDLRHTHATWLIAEGQPITTVSERLGHAKTSITLDVYAHVVKQTRDRAAQAMSDLLFGDTEEGE